MKQMVHPLFGRNHIEEPGFRELRDKFGKKGRSSMKAFKLKGNDTRILKKLSLFDRETRTEDQGCR